MMRGEPATGVRQGAVAQHGAWAPVHGPIAFANTLSRLGGEHHPRGVGGVVVASRGSCRVARASGIAGGYSEVAKASLS